MPIWDAILLGVIQGLTEFLPISSTAHLLVARQLLGHEKPEDAFTTVVQMGTLAAVLGYFRRDVLAILRAVWIDLRTCRFASSPESRLAWLIVLGSVPAGVAGLVLKKWLKATFYNTTAMAVVAIVFALLMAAAELWARARRNVANPGQGEGDVGWKEALWVGLWQALALMPGASRSGATITGGLFAGLTRPAAARFSFLLSLPVMTAAGLKELYDERHELLGSADHAVPLAVGTLVAGVVGYASIAWLLHYLKRYSMAVFVVYRIALGALILALVAAGYLRE
jgi:undecaprenyl-diphosphatase